jgi:hypothetical protein
MCIFDRGGAEGVGGSLGVQQHGRSYYVKAELVDGGTEATAKDSG